jgi:hypothetical protein
MGGALGVEALQPEEEPYLRYFRVGSIVASDQPVKQSSPASFMRSLLPPEPHPSQRRLSEADAVDIWIARWLRIRRKDLVARYGCDPRRLYEVWEGTRFPGSREQALARFAELYPRLAERIDFGLHRRIPRSITTEAQGDLFDCRSARNK